MFGYQRVKALISGTTAIDITDQTDRRVILMHLIMSLLTLLFTGSAIYHLIAGDPLYVIGALLIAPTGLLPLLYFRKTMAFAEASRLGAIALFVGLITFVLIHEGRDYSLIWTIFFPLYVFLVRGSKKGLRYSLVFYAILFAVAYWNIGTWEGWNLTSFLRFAIVSAVLTYTCYFYERSHDEAYAMLETVRDRDREYVRMLEKLSLTDPLTHLYNRRYLVDMFMRLFNSAKRHDLIFALMLIDLDFFKPYNDTYGHPEGDKVLIRVAGVLTEVLRRGDDYAFRIGGEEFCCLVMAENSEQIRATAEAVRSGIEALQISHRASPEGVMTASVGICLIESMEHGDLEGMFKRADDALYQAKQEGRNRVVMHQSL